jgi:hypothetical protein
VNHFHKYEHLKEPKKRANFEIEDNGKVKFRGDGEKQAQDDISLSLSSMMGRSGFDYDKNPGLWAFIKHQIFKK